MLQQGSRASEPHRRPEIGGSITGGGSIGTPGIKARILVGAGNAGKRKWWWARAYSGSSYLAMAMKSETLVKEAMMDMLRQDMVHSVSNIGHAVSLVGSLIPARSRK